MLKWLCENCREYRPHTQERCRCSGETESMFGDDWDAQEPEIRVVTRRRRVFERSSDAASEPQYA